MAVAKSPFLIFQDFISPLLCEDVADAMDFISPDLDSEGKPLRMIRHAEESQEILFERFIELLPKMQEHYGVTYKGMEPMSFEWYDEGVELKPQCENAEYLRKKWVRTKSRDFTAVLFLSDYQDKVPFDSIYEVYGGKLEFPQHQFGFNPQRGTLIVFPSGPHFINLISPILFGELSLVRMQCACEAPFVYQPDDFPGDYTSWLAGL